MTMKRLVAFVGASLLAVCVSVVAIGASGCGSSSSDGAGGGASDGAAQDGTFGDGASSLDGGGAETSTQAPDGAACGPAACTGIAGACGTMVDACGQTVTCEPCRYTRQDVDAGSVEWLALAMRPADTSPTLAIGSQGTVKLATASGSGWQYEQVAPQGDAGAPSLYGLDLAIAPDGSPWLAFVDLAGGTAHASVAHRAAGAWTLDPLGTASAAAVAIADDGTPYVAYAGSVTGQPAGTNGAVLASYSGGAWTRTLVAASNRVGYVALAMHGNEPHLAWLDNGSTVRYARPNGAAFTVEDVDTITTLGASFYLAIAVDTAGRPHVGYYPYGAAMHAVRDAAWTRDTVTGSGHGNGPMHVATSPGGQLAFGAIDDVFGTLMMGFGGKPWSLQELSGNCRSGTPRMAMAFDGAGALHVAHTCGIFGGVTLLAQSGIYPVGYGAACDSIVTSLCNTACACPRKTGGDCCISSSTGSECMGPVSYCPNSERGHFCSDPTIDPVSVFACRDDLAQTACNPDGGAGAILTPACTAIHR